MSENTVEEKIVTPAVTAVEDLSKRLEQTLERQPDERLKVVRLFGDYYRCNWWVQDKTPQALWLETGTIRKSNFLRATKTVEGLLVVNMK